MLVVNELSFSGALPDGRAGFQLIDDLVATLVSVQRESSERPLELRVHQGFWMDALADAATVLSWHGQHASRDARVYLMQLTSKTPPIEKEIEELERKCNIVSASTVAGKTALGAQLAWLAEGFLASIATEEFSCPALQVKSCWCGVDDTVEEQVEAEILNLFSPACSGRYTSALRGRVDRGEDLVMDFGVLFPNLELAPGAKKQLLHIKHGDPVLRKVKKHLIALQTRAALWSSGDFSTGLGLDNSPESQATLQTYGSDRMFPLDDRRVAQFSEHTKMSGINWRIYYLPRRPGEKVAIGYIGMKLPTVKYPTM